MEMDAQTPLNIDSNADLSVLVFAMSALLDGKEIFIEKQKTTLQQKNETIDYLQSRVETLEHNLKCLKNHTYGKKSEKIIPEQMRMFDEIQEPDNQKEVEQTDEAITVAAHTRKKTPGRKPLPENLPRIKKEYDLTEAEKICPCGCDMARIGEETSEQLDYIPAKLQVIRHIRYKYACKTCAEGVKIADLPKFPIPKSIATPGLLAQVAVSKFMDYAPLYRQETMFKRIGVDLARSTLSSWMIKTGDLLEPLVKLIQSDIEDYDIASADETPVQVLKEPGRSAESKSYMWLFGGGPPGKEGWVYDYHPSRSAQIPKTFLEDFTGYLHSDGYSGYNDLPGVIRVGCWAHCRRKFYAIVQASQTEGLAHHAVKTIAKLYRIEKDTRGLLPEVRHEIRLKKALPIINSFKKWLDKHHHKVPPQSPIGKAILYALNQWKALNAYLKDGRLQIDNNHSERAIKPFVMGRKNWLFSDTPQGAKSSAIIYSVIETCKLHEVNPCEYLRTVLEKLPYCESLEDYEALMPYNLKEKLAAKS